MKKLGIIVGSIRKDSYHKIIAQKLVELLPEDYEAEFIDIADVPIYSEDYDNGILEEPQSYKRVREQASKVDGFIVLSPEYNRSVPGGMKNIIDVLSRPAGRFVFSHKPVMVLTASRGQMGGILANHYLRSSLMFLDADVMAQPEMYLGTIDKYIIDGVIQEKTLEKIKAGLAAFINFAERHYGIMD
ncbi:MAG: NADPH-dependent FMN reductase [Coriobacteriia bacterium]|nr:NADPH-dependent FMN reductase [Coriobacteriia bacterium]